MSETRTTNAFQDASVLPLLRRHWGLILFGSIAFIVIGIWFRLSFYDTGYAPEQPIHYSHKLHAGDLGIDCRYCHFNAERGKHAGIPPTSVCLGCHATDKGGVNADQPEIKKLLAMAASDTGTYVNTDTGVVHEGGAIHWNRVHKLPDFVYFSHQWHVKAGVACQTCHGPVEEMVVVRQHAKLTMGWCIECHRDSNYVGGREYDVNDPATFTVGTGDYDVIRARIKPDEVVTFTQRQTHPHTHEGDAHAAEAHDDHGADAHGHAHSHGIDRPFGSDGAPTPAQDQALAQLLEKFPQLKGAPTWRLADLPETHRSIYSDLILHKSGKTSLDQLTTDDERRWLAMLSFQNSPTQCSTCHQ